MLRRDCVSVATSCSWFTRSVAWAQPSFFLLSSILPFSRFEFDTVTLLAWPLCRRADANACSCSPMFILLLSTDSSRSHSFLLRFAFPSPLIVERLQRLLFRVADALTS